MGNIITKNDLDAIIQRIKSLRADSPALWGKMDVNQMVVHLSDQLRCALGDMKTQRMGNILHRTLAKWLVMAGMKAPKGKVKTVPEFDQALKGTRVTSFEADRQALHTLLERFAAAPDAYPWQEHPAFGHLNKKQWGRLAYTHLDHHLSQFGV